MPALPARALVLLALGPFVTAQASWSQLTPATAPSPRAGTQGVTDGATLLLFGGKPNSTSELNDFWRFDGTAWSNITPAGVSPPPRDFYGATFDLGRGRYVLFGGRSGTSILGDLWEHDGTSWSQITPAVSPGVRRWVQLCYDPARAETILFGGNDGTNYLNDTWSWNGAAWTLKAPATSPSIRARGRLCYDISRAEMVYYGGRNSTTALSDTWRWDGSDWSQIVTATAPGDSVGAGLFAYGMTYDVLRDRYVLFGGTRTGATLSGTWEFDGVDWAQRAVTGPGNRTGCAVAFVLALGKNYMFGGFQGPQWGDTWEYQTANLASAISYGAGCSGSGGLLTLAPQNAPWLGDVFQIQASNLAPSSLAFLVAGFSNTSWAAGPLPTPLSNLHPAGGSGCDLLASNEAVILLANSGGMASGSFGLPLLPGLAGFQLYQQILEIELAGGGSIASINASNGLELTIGAR